jgi:hypothetical protein
MKTRIHLILAAALSSSTTLAAPRFVDAARTVAVDPARGADRRVS